MQVNLKATELLEIKKISLSIGLVRALRRKFTYFSDLGAQM
jgi:hypothetical protein